jgi:hypothetical protein
LSYVGRSEIKLPSQPFSKDGPLIVAYGLLAASSILADLRGENVAVDAECQRRSESALNLAA